MTIENMTVGDELAIERFASGVSQQAKRVELLRRERGLIAYLQLKVEEKDWHGVADAAMDLREVDAQLKML